MIFVRYFNGIRDRIRTLQGVPQTEAEDAGVSSAERRSLPYQADTYTGGVTECKNDCASAPKLNEELVEAIALGHDLGHTPFGHAGERSSQQGCARMFRRNRMQSRARRGICGESKDGG